MLSVVWSCVLILLAPDLLRQVGSRETNLQNLADINDGHASGSSENMLVSSDHSESYRRAVRKGMTHHALRPSGGQHKEHATDAQPSRNLHSAQLGVSIEATNTTKSRSNPYVGICAIVKNEQRNIQEWIDYHHWIGVGKFYIYDHGSSLSVAAQLQKYIAAGELMTTGRASAP